MRWIGFIVLLICAFPLSAQIGSVSKSTIDSLNQATKADSNSLFDRIRMGERCWKLSETIGYEEGSFEALMNIGTGYLNLGNLKEALDHFQQANSLAIDLKRPSLQAQAAYFLGNVHNNLENFEKAMAFFQESLVLYESIDNVRWGGRLKNAIGVVLSRAGNRDAGLAAFQEALAIMESNKLEEDSSFPINNIGEHYLQEGQPEKALPYYQKSLELSKKYNLVKGEVISLSNVGLSYRDMGQYEKAIQYFEESLALAIQHHFNSEIYEIYMEMAIAYDEMKLSSKALQYYKKYAALKDSILSNEQEEQIAALLVEYETEKKERELIESREQISELQQNQRFQRLLGFAIILGFGLALAIILLLYSRNKVKQELVESDLKNKRLESERLKSELEFKQKDLTNFALDIARKNKFSDKVHASLHLIHQSNDASFRKEKIKELLILTSNHLKVNEDIQEFQMNVEKVNHDFFHRLSTQFPELTNSEKQLCGLLRLNLSSKDIASIRNISTKSVEMSRYRLRKKLHLDSQEEINTFLQKI